jgi:diguanylate cyclase (GGDEF)-like protein
MSSAAQLVACLRLVARQRDGTRVAPSSPVPTSPNAPPLERRTRSATEPVAPRQLLGLRTYTNGVIAVGAALLVPSILGLRTVDPWMFFALVTLAVTTSLFKLDLRLADGNATMTLGYAVGFLGLFTLGANATALAVGAGVWTQCTYASGLTAVMDLRRRLFSVACGLITVQVAGLAYVEAGGQSGGAKSLLGAAALAAAALIYFFVNSVIIAGAIALSTRQGLGTVWQRNFLMSWPSYFVSAIVVGFGVGLVSQTGFIAGLLLLAPLVLTFLAYRTYLWRLADNQEQLQRAKDRNGIDGLTGLPNRVHFVSCLDRALAEQRGDSTRKLALLFADLDGFKQINDGMGHHVGDQLLQALARRLDESLRATDLVARPGVLGGHVESTVARLGGDEFVVLLDRLSNADDAQRIGERLRQSLARPFHIDGRKVHVTVSVGLTFGSPASGSADEMLREADAAMYRAKTLGKDRLEVFDVNVKGLVQGRVERDADLRRAVEQHDFVPYFQPIVSLATGRLVGFEALLRWRHPDHGIIEPPHFMSLMEEQGLVGEVGRRFFRDVCQQLAAWRAENAAGPSLRVHVNFSGQQFLEPELVDTLLESVNTVGLAPENMVIEVTESSAIRQFARAATVLERAKAAGFSIVLDDFGTGYSALSCLHELPISGIKLDRSFLVRERQHPAILQAMIGLADQLDLAVTAEGVETVEQCAQLQGLGCGFAQGYLFARPGSATQAVAMLRRREVWCQPSTLAAGARPSASVRPFDWLDDRRPPADVA